MNNILRRDFSQMIYCQNDQDLTSTARVRQDLEKRSRQNRSQSLRRKMVGWEKMILSDKIN
jgi:hypothetical protein